MIKIITVHGYRIPIEFGIPGVYKNLIERRWSQRPEKHPWFDEIVKELKTNSDFISELVDECEFLDNAEYIDNHKTTFDIFKKVVRYGEFI